MDDPFVQSYDADDLAIAAEFLTNWLPFLTRGLCDGCTHHLHDRIRSLQPDPASRSGDPEPSGVTEAGDPPDHSPDPSPSPHWSEHVEPSGWDTSPPSSSPKVRMSWADMAQEDELEEEEEEEEEATRKNFAVDHECGEGAKGEGKKKTELSREQREQIRFKNVGRKKDFICLERVNGKIVNILDGLELHTGVFSVVEQKRIVDFVYELQEKGRNNQLREQTYSEPTKWMRGKGRVTIQFGCCYNYAMDKNGNPPGILQAVVADPIPHLFKVIIRRLIRWHVLPASCVPDSCIVNIYEPGDCIPPHIDSHDFVRPFCTVSFLSECNIVFGSNLKVVGAGDFSGSTAIPLPVGSVLVLNGNGADVAKHCVPAVPTKRISITFRKMDEAKQPFGFQPEPDLQNIQLLLYGLGGTESKHQTRNKQSAADGKSLHKGRRSRGKPHGIGAKSELDFQDNRHYLGDTETPLTRLPRQVIDARSASSGDYSERGKRASGRPSEQKHFQDDGEDGPVRRWRQQTAAGEDGSNFEGSKELGGRRVILDQRRIIISRNMEGEGEHLLTGSRNSEPSHLSQIQIRPPNNGRRRVRVSLSDD